MFVFDTYAIIEIINGNSNYDNYLDEDFIINDFIFAELCYILIREGYPNPDKYLEKYAKHVLHVKAVLIEEAMKFRFENRRKTLSIPDSVSYFQAKDLKIKFLTGDKEFEEMENIEFVK